MLAEHEAKLSKVQDEVREILAEARRDAEHTKNEILAEAQREAEAGKKRSIAEIERAKDTALKDLFDVMSTKVVNATQRVLSRSLSEAEQDRLVDEALAEFQRN
jgi:F-type H+-transporting ATPase subunit b